MRRAKGFKKWIILVIIIVFASVYIYDIVSIRLSYHTPQELADPDSKFIDIDGVNIHYKTYGNGDRVFLLIHGFGASTFSFRYVVEPLSKLGKVVVFDLTGFGLSERPERSKFNPNPYSRNGQVEITRRLIETLNLDNIILVGHSMGGTIATIFAVRYPEMVDKLVLEDPAIFETGGMPRALQIFFESPVGRFLFTLFVKPLTKSLESVIYKAFYDPSKVTADVLEGYKKSLEVTNWDKGLYEILIADNRIDFLDKISEINIPVLVVTGKNDRIVPEDDSQKINSILKNSRLILVDGCGHIPHEEKPDVFVDAVRNFIEGAWH